MGVPTQPSRPGSQYVIPPPNCKATAEAVAHTGLNSPTTSTSMSQGFHQGIFSFSDGFVDRSVSQDQQQHVAQQSRRDKLRVQGFDGVPAQHHPLVPIEEEGGADVGIYESSAVGEPGGNMLSDMFNFAAAGPTATELLASQISGAGGYRFPLQRPGGVAGFPGDWYGASRQGMLMGGTSNLGSIGGESTSKHHLDDSQQQHQVAGLNAESAAAMQLFLMNPPPQAEQQPRSPPRAPPAALHPQALIQSFGEAPFAGGLVEGRGLSLSLSSSLQPLEMAKTEELRVREGVLYFNNQQQEHPQQQPPAAAQQQIHMGYGAMGVVNVLRNSKYSRAAQELLEEFCSVGRGQLKGNKMAKRGSSNPNPNASSGAGGGAGAGASTSAATTSSAKDATPLSPADRFEHQRKKTKLISMLDEVDRRYNHYCDQMQMVVNSFDTVMGFGAATPYTALAQKAMSRHFRCLKDAIAAQLKQTCELLGEKEGASSSGITKGETPRLRLLDQSLRQQRAFHQMGMMEQEAWRPQRGLPERSVNILRAWLFEHFLHPYPSDADKHLLARQTGLSRNQVSNWFINARVRLWKPMVEDMYQQEFKDGEEGEKSEASHQATSQSPTQQQQQQHLQQDQRAQLTNVSSEAEPSPSSSSISRHHHRFGMSSDNAPALAHHHTGGGSDSVFIGVDALSAHSHIGPAAEDMYRYGAAAAAAAAALGPAARMRFGTAAGDVSLTLGLRHGAGGNAPESSRSSSLRDFGS